MPSSDKDFLHANPKVHDMVAAFSAGELKHKVLTCKGCNEIRPQFHSTTPSDKFKLENRNPQEVHNWKIFKDGLCERCHKESLSARKDGKKVMKFSGIYSCGADPVDGISHNNMHFAEVPPFLANLTFIETLMIRKITVAMYVHNLKYGMLASKGHAVSIPQDVKVFTKLPLLPAEIGILILKNANTNSRKYIASRQSVQNALDGLVFGVPKFGVASCLPGYKMYKGKDHCSGVKLHDKYFEYPPNPYYFDVTIEKERLTTLPESPSHVSLPTIIDASTDQETEDIGPAKDQFDHLNEDEEIASYSGIAVPLDMCDADEEVKKLLEKFLHNSSQTWEQVIEAGKVAAMQFNNKTAGQKLIPELSTDGFFTMAYPHIFVYGTCDITIKKVREVDYLQWVEHIYFTMDNRVAAHPFLKFHLLNLGLRRRALTQGSFCVSQQINEPLLTIDELQERLNAGDDSIGRKIISMAANLPNTGPYWRTRKAELDSLHFFALKEFQVMPTYFDTSSCAEHHWTPLHQLLIKYYSVINGLNEIDVKYRFDNESSFKHELLMKNTHIVTSYFSARHTNYQNTVLKELFDYQEFWGRYEFAKSRGQIHDHSEYFSREHYQRVKSIIDIDDTNEEVKKADLLQDWLQSDDNNTDSVFSPKFVSMHPAGGEMVFEGESQEWHPDKDKWLAPEGKATVSSGILSASIGDCQSTTQLKDFQIDVVNKVMIHTCSSYCLRRETVKKGNDSNKSVKPSEVKETVVRKCRMNFGTYDEKTKTSSGKPIDPFLSNITGGAHPRYEGCRDHPRLVQHVAMRPLSWLANCDTQPIIEHNLIALMRYVAGYACKGACTTSDMLHIYNNLLAVAPSNTSLKSIAQKLLMKAVGIVDTPATAADFINTGNKLYKVSRKFRRIGLSGYRIIDNSGSNKGTVMTKNTPLDDFLSDKRRQEDLTICLYDWAKKCNCPKSKSCGIDHVPHFTGFKSYYTWPVEEDFAKGLLMQFSVGTWRKVDDVLTVGDQVHSDYRSAFASFLDTEQCPEAVKIMLEFARIQYDEKMKKEKYKHFRDTNLDINWSQSTNSLSTSSQCSQGETLGCRLIRDIAKQQRIHLLQGEVDDVDLPDGGPTFDWHQDGIQKLQLNGFTGDVNEDMISKAKEWLSDVSTEAENDEIQHGNECALPNVKPLLVNYKQMMCVLINMKKLFDIAKGDVDPTSASNRLMIQGCAGTGKSQIIQILTRLTRRLFKCNRAVLNTAYTGAASNLLPDGRTIHSFVHPPKKSKVAGDTLSINDCPLSASNMNKLKNILLSNDVLQLMCCNTDELSMISQDLMAWYDQRICVLSNNLYPNLDKRPFGCIPLFNLSGDNLQLGPICGTDLYEKPVSSSKPCDIAGHFLYNSFTDSIVLDEVMRQKPSQQTLLRRLSHIRCGEVTDEDWNEINERAFCNLTDDEKLNFGNDNPNLMWLCETWNEANKHNYEVLATLGAPVAVIPSTGSGRHNIPKGQVGQIPSRCVLAYGSRVILTKNQGVLTSFGLNNGAIGKVVSILYSEGKSPPQNPEVIVVDFPKYNGPHWLEHHPTWVPITVNDTRCEDNCCTRKGFPLIPAYGITIAKSQGTTIGRGKQITHAVIKLNSKIDMEKLNLGTAYTAFSRVCEDSDWCLAETIPFERLEYINRHPKMKRRLIEEKRLLELDNSTCERYTCEVEDYVSLLQEIDVFCSDGIQDSVCDMEISTNICNCCIHRR